MEDQEKSNSQPAWKPILFTFVILVLVFFVIKACDSGGGTVSTPKPTLDWDKDSYSMQYDTKDFTTYPANYKGDKVALKCEVFNVIDESQFQCWTLDERKPVGVITREDFTRLYEDEKITVYGYGGGESCGKNAFGAKVCQALITKAWYTKP